ncbi:MAG: endonuclease/exonuclease/phosphatase family protein [Bacteroidales bacterium]|nr:endonuclease/exonuclease/phosphatase family protein [Bacteroidales bacterium]
MRRFIPYWLVVAGILFSSAGGCGSDPVEEVGDGPYKWGEEIEMTPVVIDKDKTYFPKQAGVFRIMSYNVGALHKYITNLTDNVNMVASMIGEARPDVVGLNELDSCNARCDQFQLKLLAQATGKWDYFYGKTLDYRGGGYGNGIMAPSGTKVNIIHRVHFKNDTKYENRGMVVIETDDYVLGATHLDHSSEDYIQSQISEINAWFLTKYRDSDIPVFLCGDMNSKPGSEAIEALGSCWEIISNTSELTTSSNTIDYIFHLKRSAAVEVSGAHTLNRFYNGDPDKASDHFPIYVDVKIK